ncbi:restriction endonuclease subunit S [Streptomyces coelicoflavus]|uniref:restriction endonuclease subunit S n=1 Tax=Streptomyces TaxID=1883 RepID=UPI00188518C6|nr:MULTISPECIES: restriction endonuclease subunit S [Streptomyces]MCX5036944.1 restriction endonuclease subunit S [Streptomyces coelicoflavus]
MTTADGSRSPDRSVRHGSVPHRWLLKPLKSLCESVQTGPSVRGADRGRTQADGDVPIVLPRDLRGNRVVTEEPETVPAMPWERARTLEKYVLREGDILVARTGTVGRLALVTGEHTGWLYHHGLVRLRLPAEGPARAAYLAAYLGSEGAQDWLRARSAGSVVPSVSTRTLGELPVLLPPPTEQQTIGDTLAALDEKVRVHSEIARVTGEYRRTLAEALLAGTFTATP